MSLPLVVGVLLFATLLSFPLCRTLGRRAGYPLAVLYLVSAGLLAPSAAAVMAGSTPEWSVPWLPAWGVTFSLRPDGLGVIFAYIALLIGAVVLCYSASYLSAKGTQTSFYAVMAAFTLAMVTLVLTDDVVVAFVCWELTSIASFMLIARGGPGGEWPSFRTLFLTFIGGLSLLIAVALIVQRTRTTSMSAAFAHAAFQDLSFTTLTAVFVLIAGFTKAAQFPFHVWLPDAMAAATPVSAYLHAAAVVKAGIFILLRFSPVFHTTPVWNVALIAVGLFTALLGAFFALQRNDLKRVMAYSTVSQLGFIVATIGVGTEAAMLAAVLHTIAHALFKSGLFMMVGVVDHAVHTRELTRLPQLYRAMPVSFAVTVIGCASMAGIPPMLGFASKEAIFTALYGSPWSQAIGVALLAVAAVAAVLTFAYCVRITLGGFVDGTNERPIERVDAPTIATAALPILAGVPLAFMLPVLDTPVARAVEATLPGSHPHPHLALWHGVTVELLVTLAVLAAGTAIAVWRHRLLVRVPRTSLPDGASVLASLARGSRRVGALTARPALSDTPNRHTGLILLCFVALLTAWTVWFGTQQTLPARREDLSRMIDWVLLPLIAVCVLGVCIGRSRVAAVVSLSGVGILATVQIVALGAPDVALTQLMVDTLTIIAIMLVLQKLPLDFGPRHGLRGWPSIVMAAIVGLTAGLAVYLSTGRRDRSPIGSYYLDDAPSVAGAKNIVNVILVEFRALDTLGELAVLGMAGIAVVAVISTLRDRYVDPEGREFRHGVKLPDLALRPSGSPAHAAITTAWSNAVPLQMVLRGVVPALFGVSLWLFLRGHNAPGGGFIAALVGAAALGLLYVSTSSDRQIGPPRLPRYLIGGGILTSAATGLVGYVRGEFLEPLHGYLFGVHFTTSMVFDVGVYLGVLGLFLVAVNLLGTSDAAGATGGESTRERADELVEGELSGPMESTHGERPTLVGARTTYFSTPGREPREPGR